MTLAGGIALPLLDAKLTTAPLEGAGPFRVTVPVDGEPPVTDVGDMVRLEGTAGETVRPAVTVVVPAAAVIVAVVEVATAPVEIVNEAVKAPAATVTFGGVTATVLLEDRLTRIPPEGAGPLKVTVPVEGVPPINEVGVSPRLDNPTGGVIVSVAVAELPPEEAVITALVLVETGVVAIVKVAWVAPPGTTMKAGVVAEQLPLLSVTMSPPAGAALDKDTVAIEPAPPVTMPGFRLKFDMAIVLTSVPTA